MRLEIISSTDTRSVRTLKLNKPCLKLYKLSLKVQTAQGEFIVDYCSCFLSDFLSTDVTFVEKLKKLTFVFCLFVRGLFFLLIRRRHHYR